MGKAFKSHQTNEYSSKETVVIGDQMLTDVLVVIVMDFILSWSFQLNEQMDL